MRPALDLLRKRDAVFERRGLVAAPVEVIEKRTERSKTFSIGPNTFHLSQSIGPVHYKDENGDWQEIDLTFRAAETEAGLVYRMDKAAYIAEVFTDRVGWRHVSREGWWRQVELLAIDGRPVEYGGTVRVNDNVVLYDGVAPGIDMKVCAYRLKSEVFKKLEQPCELTWRVTQSDGAGGVFQEKTAGWDKGGDTLEMVTRLEGETFTETWTGRVSKVADKRTRRKVWTTEPEYPVVVDASITENIAANADDGFEVAYFGTWRPVTGGNTRWRAGGSNSYPIHAGLRFTTIALQGGATIVSSTITISPTALTGTISTKLYGDDVDDAAAWSNGNLPSGITKTTATVTVVPTVSGPGYTINVEAVVAELAARVGWASGNDMRFGIIRQAANTGYFLAEDYNAAGTNEAQLDITYTAASVPFRRTLLGVGF